MSLKAVLAVGSLSFLAAVFAAVVDVASVGAAAEGPVGYGAAASAVVDTAAVGAAAEVPVGYGVAAASAVVDTAVLVAFVAALSVVAAVAAQWQVLVSDMGLCVGNPLFALVGSPEKE